MPPLGTVPAADCSRTGPPVPADGPVAGRVTGEEAPEAVGRGEEGRGEVSGRVEPSSLLLCGSLPRSSPVTASPTAVPSTPSVSTATEAATTARLLRPGPAAAAAPIRSGTRAMARIPGLRTEPEPAGAPADSSRPSARSRSSIRRAAAAPRTSPSVDRSVSAASNSTTAWPGSWTQRAYTPSSWWNQASSAPAPVRRAASRPSRSARSQAPQRSARARAGAAARASRRTESCRPAARSASSTPITTSASAAICGSETEECPTHQEKCWAAPSTLSRAGQCGASSSSAPAVSRWWPPIETASPASASSASALSPWPTSIRAGRCGAVGHSPPRATASLSTACAVSLSPSANRTAGRVDSATEGSGTVPRSAASRTAGSGSCTGSRTAPKTSIRSSSAATSASTATSRCRSNAAAWTKRSGRPSDSNQRSTAQAFSAASRGRPASRAARARQAGRERPATRWSWSRESAGISGPSAEEEIRKAQSGAVASSASSSAPTGSTSSMTTIAPTPARCSASWPGSGRKPGAWWVAAKSSWSRSAAVRRWPRSWTTPPGARSPAAEATADSRVLRPEPAWPTRRIERPSASRPSSWATSASRSSSGRSAGPAPSASGPTWPPGSPAGPRAGAPGPVRRGRGRHSSGQGLTSEPSGPPTPTSSPPETSSPFRVRTDSCRKSPVGCATFCSAPRSRRRPVPAGVVRGRESGPAAVS